MEHSRVWILWTQKKAASKNCYVCTHLDLSHNALQIPRLIYYLTYSKYTDPKALLSSFESNYLKNTLL